MSDRYADIINRCLQQEDPAHRDAVLAEYPPQTQAIVRRLLQDLDKRLATYVARGDTRAERNDRLNAIREPWLRERVRAMVIERHQQRREQRQQEAQP